MAISVRRYITIWTIPSPLSKIHCAPAILFRIVQKFKMAANLERIQQQMQTELEKFKAVQKGTL